MEFVTANGNKKVEINVSSWKNVTNLKQVIYKILGDNVKSIDTSGNINFIEVFPQILISCETSPDFEKAVAACLSDCIYDGFFKIDERLFNDKPDARQDYYEILSHCVEENLRPLWKSLVTELKKRLAQIPNDDQKL